MDRATVAGSLIFGLVVTVSIVIWAVFRARRSRPWWIVGHLSTPGTQLEIPVRASTSTWNPAKPLGIDNGIYVPGVATYSRRTAEPGDLIHLEFVAKGGSAQQFEGPIPDVAISGSDANRRARRLLSMGYALAFGPLVLVIGGVIIAVLNPSGLDEAVVIGVVVGFVLLLVVAPLVLNVARAVGQTLRRTGG